MNYLSITSIANLTELALNTQATLIKIKVQEKKKSLEWYHICVL